MKKEKMKSGRSVDFERETRVLLEDVQSNVRLIAEGHSSIVGSLKNIDARLDKVEGRLGAVESMLGSVESELYSVKMAVFDLNTRIAKVENKH